MKSKLRTMIVAVVSLVAGLFVCVNLHPENWMKKGEATVPLSQMQKEDGNIYTGRLPDRDVPRLSGKEEFEELFQIDEVTVEPIGIVPTGISSLNGWADPYRGRAGTRNYKRKREVQKNFWYIFDILDDYSQYYLIQCPDKSYILAQMPEQYVKALKKGEKTVLPIGHKASLRPQAKSYLTEICQKYDASLDGVLYTFDDAWYQEHSFMILLIRLGAGAAAFFVTGVIIFLLADKLRLMEL